MSAWDQHLQPVIAQDPLAVLLSAIGDVKALVIDLKDTDLTYVKQRIDKQWLAIDDLEKRKADKPEIEAVEARVLKRAYDYYDRVNDEVTRVQDLAETSDAAFDSLQTRLTEIEKETAKIPGMSESIKDLSKQVGRINRLRWQMAGAATATGVLGLSAGFFIKAFLHFNWLEHIIR